MSPVDPSVSIGRTFTRLISLGVIIVTAASVCSRDFSTDKEPEEITIQATEPVFVDDPPAEGAELIGSEAPKWDNELWIHSDPLKLQDLRGQVVLVRFWTDTCPFCEASAPALGQLHSEYGSKGLKVIGMYHPKPPRDEPLSSVKKSAERLGISFPIAVDNDWATLRKYWTGSSTRRGYTSVSFLIGKRGKIRHIHPGPEFHADPTGEHPVCEKEFRRMERWVQKLLAEEGPS
ncbi:MAG: redoxin domain-containing protein [Planctomycetota bacterium]|nr:redoxin domain-containing protein [Planctomycetota bacterium]